MGAEYKKLKDTSEYPIIKELDNGNLIITNKDDYTEVSFISDTICSDGKGLKETEETQ